MFLLDSKIKDVIIFLLLVLSSQIISQTNPDINFFPLNVGDTWQYSVIESYKSENGRDTTYHVTSKVIGVESIDGKIYSIVKDGYLKYNRFIRIDSTDASVWEYKFGTECMIDSLSMSAGVDGIRNECFAFVDCGSDSLEIVLDEEVRVKRLQYVVPITSIYAERGEFHNAYGIGRIYKRTVKPTPFGDDVIIQSIVFASINGKEYGRYIKNHDVDFYPLNEGDVRVYEVRYNDNYAYDSLYYETVSVIGTEFYNGKKFYKIESSIEGITYIRVDSLDATVWEYKDGYECMIDSLSVLTDTIVINGCDQIRFFGNKVDTIFNREVEVRTFGYAYVISSGTTYLYSYAKGFGLVSYSKSFVNVWATTTKKELIYAKVDGVIYRKNYLDYYPVAVGNKWVYYYSSYTSYDGYPSFTEYTYSVKITKDTTLTNGKHYFYLNDHWGRWIRVDTLENRIYQIENIDNESECLIVDLKANSVVEYDICYGYVNNVVSKDTMLWNKNRGSKIYHLNTLSTYEETYVEGIGLSSEKFSFDFGYGTRTLKGAIIDGIVFGDTLVTVEQIGENIPTEYTLFQNYPNPFNPSTTINYSIPANINSGSSLVELIVYDVLGREVSTLVNKTQKAGNYKVTFNASNLPSGVYFYQIKTNEFSQVRKMILIK